MTVRFAFVLAFAPAVALAGPNYTNAPLYGSANLSAGFTPDPIVVNVQAGGGTPVAQAGLPDTCRGHIAPNQPDYRVNYTAGGQSQLRFGACADADVALVINDPRGGWHCNDDTEGRNPVVNFNGPMSGQYDVWVATYSEGATQPSQLKITELGGQICGGGSSAPAAAAVTSGSRSIEITGQPRYGTATLSAGFTPDPRTVQVVAGGNTNVSDVNGLPENCRGYIVTDTPDYRLDFTAGASPLRIAACAGEDVTLVVNDAQGNWRCTDDDEGRNPVLTINNPPSGRYDIFVGVYSSASTVPSTVKISELSGTLCQ